MTKRQWRRIRATLHKKENTNYNYRRHRLDPRPRFRRLGQAIGEEIMRYSNRESFMRRYLRMVDAQ